MGNETVANIVSYMVDFVDQVSDEITLIAVREYAARIQAAHAREVARAVANERARDVHTCHDQCERPLCALTRRAEAAEAMSGEPGLLRLLVDLRFALGDNGKRMQDELVEFAREIATDARDAGALRQASKRVCDAFRAHGRADVSALAATRAECEASIIALEAIASGGEDRKA